MKLRERLKVGAAAKKKPAVMAKRKQMSCEDIAQLAPAWRRYSFCSSFDVEAKDGFLCELLCMSRDGQG
jgi:hypothetical protein